MGYLAPPPAPAPVIVQKDVGGLVSEYQAMTAIYRRENREVRLHECRSACTLALSLPNVCVYPDSVLKFHSAYNRDTKQVDRGVSAELFNSYPPAVRERLGYLTRNYRSLSGRELIDLGVRDCTKPRSETMIARAQQAPAATRVASAAPAATGPDPVGALVSGVKSFFANNLGGGGATPTAVAQRPPLPGPVLTASLQAPRALAELDAPLPPPRPSELDGAALVRVAARDAEEGASATDAPRVRLPRMITGAQPILPPRFMAYAALR